jgi:hypothetical protein
MELQIRWAVKTVVPKPRLNGYIVTNEGGIYHNEEELMLGKGTALVIKE